MASASRAEGEGQCRYRVAVLAPARRAMASIVSPAGPWSASWSRAGRNEIAMSTGSAAGRWRPVTDWIATVIMVAESLTGGAADLLRLDPFFPLLTQLGYPSYLAAILGRPPTS
jgi:hypothetical protein